MQILNNSICINKGNTQKCLISQHYLSTLQEVAGGELIESSVEIAMEQVCGAGYSLMPSDEGLVCGSYKRCNLCYPLVAMEIAVMELWKLTLNSSLGLLIKLKRERNLLHFISLFHYFLGILMFLQ